MVSFQNLFHCSRFTVLASGVPNVMMNVVFVPRLHPSGSVLGVPKSDLVAGVVRFLNSRDGRAAGKECSTVSVEAALKNLAKRSLLRVTDANR